MCTCVRIFEHYVTVQSPTDHAFLFFSLKQLVKGSCLSPNSSYIACEDREGNLDTFYTTKAEYRLPPNLVAQACDIDDRCVAFMVTNDRQHGFLLEHFRSPTVKGVYTLANFSRPDDDPTRGVTVDRSEAGARIRAVNGHMTMQVRLRGVQQGE